MHYFATHTILRLYVLFCTILRIAQAQQPADQTDEDRPAAMNGNDPPLDLQEPDEEERERRRQVCQEAKQKASGKWEVDCDGAYFQSVVNMSMSNQDAMLGAILLSAEKRNAILAPINLTQVPAHLATTFQLPASFDARQKWPACSAIISTIRQQSRCGSCTFVTAGSVITDRACIANTRRCNWAGTDPASAYNWYSEAELLSCVPPKSWDGCRGWWVPYSFIYVHDNGLVTGTPYAQAGGCKPYPFPPHLDHRQVAPSCNQSTCTNPQFSPSYNISCGRVKAAAVHRIEFEPDKVSAAELAKAVELAQRAMMAQGSIGMGYLEVFEDFAAYKSGVYQHVAGKSRGRHAVRCFGWGTETSSNGTQTPYWLCANSWGSGFGDGGLFKILRGQNHADIERDISWPTLPDDCDWCAECVRNCSSCRSCLILAPLDMTGGCSDCANCAGCAKCARCMDPS